MLRNPILITAASELFWVGLLVVSRISMQRFELEPWSFSFVQLCAGGAVLLLVGGWRQLNFSSFLRPMTWVLGALRVMSAAAFTAVLVWVSVLEAGIMAAINVPMVAAAVWFAFGRRPARGEWLGHVLILAPIPFLIIRLEGGFAHPVVWLMLFNEICLVASIIVAERHPDNISDQPGARMRFTGAVLLVTAFMFLVVRGVQGGMDSGAFDGVLLLCGVVVGICLRAPAMLLSFASIRLVGAQNYMLAIALMPLTGMVFEEIAVAAGLLDASRFQIELVGLSLVALVGSAAVVVARMRSRPKPVPV